VSPSKRLKFKLNVLCEIPHCFWCGVLFRAPERVTVLVTLFCFQARS
jgi:hypothetical protein